MNLVIIIQARIGSTRLAGKVLRMLGDRTVLGHVIRRCKAVPSVTKVVVATTVLDQDNVIFDETIKYGVSCVRGSESDVLSRYYDAALAMKADHIIRVTSDCPLIDPTIIEKLIEFYFNEKCDYARIGLDVFPRGLDAEIFSLQALETAYYHADSEFDREHVTTYIQKNRDQFKFGVYRTGENCSQYRLTLDTIEDWQLIETVYKKLYHGDIFSWIQVKNLLQENPELAMINAEVEHKHYNV